MSTPSLGGIPSEIRIKIFKNLLCSELLGTAESISVTTRFGKTERYNLNPQILRVCRQFKDEASKVLYEYNTFYIACWQPERNHRKDHIFPSPIMELTPLARYVNNQPPPPSPLPLPGLYSLDNARKVRRWRAVVSTLTLGLVAGNIWELTALHWSLQNLCRTIHSIEPKFKPKPPPAVVCLELLVVPHGMDAHFTYNYEPATYNSIEIILKPLRMLRNLRELVIKFAEETQIPDIVLCNAADDINNRMEIARFKDTFSQDLKVELETLATSNAPFEPLDRMMDALVSYAQSFECHPLFRTQMGLRQEEINEIDVINAINAFNASEDCPEIYNTINPFRMPEMHPVEEGLMHAKDALVADDIVAFKKHRLGVLTYLERQYTRIEEASLAISDYVKREKVMGGSFDAKQKRYLFPDTDMVHEAITYLEDYVSAFQRDVPRDIRCQIRAQPTYDDYYAALPRERLLAKLNEEGDRGTFASFLQQYIAACEDCDQQYFEILAARKNLWEFDIGEKDRGCNIAMRTDRCEERIDWNVNEPNLTPQCGPYQLIGVYEDDDDYYDSDDDYSLHRIA